MLFLQFIIFTALLICYQYAPEHISVTYLSIVISLALASYVLLWCFKKTNSMLTEHFISNMNLLIICFCVVSFQFPIDYIIGNNNIDFSKYFYSYSTINLSTTFNALCLVSFNIGLVHRASKCIDHTTESIANNISEIPTKALFRIMLVLWTGFIIFLNTDYVRGGHGSVTVNPISIACYGYFCRLNIIYLAINLYNIVRCEGNLSLKKAVSSQPLLYWVIVLASALIFYYGHNRVYSFYILFPAVFYLLAITRIKSRPLLSLSLIIAAGVFFTLLKIYGFDMMFTEATLDASNLVYYDRLYSFSPFTSELAGSIWADSALFNIWYNRGMVIFGSTLVLGILRIFSGLVPLFFLLTGLSERTYSSALLVTNELSASYGLGSSMSGDLIVSVGFCGALIIMYFLGRICFSGDIALFGKDYNYKGILIGLCLSSQIVFVSRSSLCDLISTSLFCMIFSNLYFKYIRT